MRQGQNPVKVMNQVNKPCRITAAVLNHIPFLEGFYANMLEVLDLSLSTLRKNAGIDFDLLVFDNGSCKEARDFLVSQFEKGNIQFLIFSEQNIGKGGAWNVMLQAAPGEIIAYADNDVLYHKDWLIESVKILETFPHVGMVTSRPFHTKPELYSAVVDWVESCSEATLERGLFVNPEWNREFLLSVGRSEEEILEDIRQPDFRIQYQGLVAYAGASHWQFLGWKKVLQEFLPLDLSKPLGQVLKLDEMIDRKGYLRLMTEQPLTMNLSNTTELPNPVSDYKTSPRKFRDRFLDLKIIKAPLMKVYNLIFRLYNDR